MNTANPIKEYYIAYMDILGYKDFFKQHSNEIPNFLERIDNAIKRTLSHIGIANNSPILKNIGNIDIKTKVFSDNILLCMETSDKPFEPLRILSFIQSVSDIQRGFVTDYGLFLRGGIKKGEMSINDNYVFGQGLIDVVEMEEKNALYPRIIIDEAIINYLCATGNTEEELERVTNIGNSLKNNQTVSQEDLVYYNNIAPSAILNNCVHFTTNNLIWKWDDDLYFVNYLHQRINPGDLLGDNFIDIFKKQLQAFSSYDFELINQPLSDPDLYLKQNKQRVEEQLQIYGHIYGNEINSDEKNVMKEEVREHILRKYIWAMAYHNRICKFTNKMDYFINTTCNCDSRYLRMVITVINEDFDA